LFVGINEYLSLDIVIIHSYIRGYTREDEKG